MALKTVQFRYGADNLGYLIHGKRTALAVDGGAVDAICEYLSDNGLELAGIVNTHSHGDHTSGNDELTRCTGAPLTDMDELHRMEKLVLEDQPIRIILTPGHTVDSVCFHHGNDLLTGDTLFNGKVGRCFTGDTRAFFESIGKLLRFPDGTFIHAGHDYLLEYLETASQLDPENRLIEVYRDGYDPCRPLTATLGWEKKVNPFIRHNQPMFIALMSSMGLPVNTEYERFSSMLTLM